jgi:hypothetical protein
LAASAQPNMHGSRRSRHKTSGRWLATSTEAGCKMLGKMASRYLVAGKLP